MFTRTWSGYPALTPNGNAVVVPSGSAMKLHTVAAGPGVALPGDMATAKGKRIHFAPDGRTALTAHDHAVSLWDWPAVSCAARSRPAAN